LNRLCYVNRRIIQNHHRHFLQTQGQLFQLLNDKVGIIRPLS
jgi:hypothetical protein